jgi:hypothetical protein
MPNWIKGTLVIAVIAVIVLAVAIGWGNLFPPVPPEEPLADVYFLQQDIFYLSVDADGNLTVDSMDARFGLGARGSETPLNFTLIDTFDEDHNITLKDIIAWDYYGNAYLLNPIIESQSINFTFGEVWPPINTTRDLEGRIEGYWSLLFGYTIDSTNDEVIRNDPLDDFITSFNCTVEPENGLLEYNQPTIVECNISLSTYPDTIVGFSYGRARLEFPRQVYNGTTLLANISVLEVTMTGTTNPPNTDYTESADKISFDTDFTFMGNDAWGFAFDLNVTTFTNESFCLLDLSTDQCEFYLQSGYQEAPFVADQPMHYPKATFDIRSDYNQTYVANYTDIYIQLPQIWVEVDSTPSTPTLILQQRPAQAIHMPHKQRLPSLTEITKPSTQQTFEMDTGRGFEARALTAPTPVFAALRRFVLF